MSSFHTIPFIFRTGFVLFCLIGHTSVLALNHIADINFVFQHIGYGKIFPKRTVFHFRLLITQTMQTFIFCRIRYASVVQHSGNGRFSIALRKQCKHLSHHSSRFLVNDQMPFLIRIFFVTI